MVQIMKKLFMVAVVVMDADVFFVVVVVVAMIVAIGRCRTLCVRVSEED
jgi:hypothetical protein